LYRVIVKVKEWFSDGFAEWISEGSPNRKTTSTNDKEK